MVGAVNIGRVSRPIRGEQVQPDGSATICGNGFINRASGLAVQMPATKAAALAQGPGLGAERAGDNVRASCNYHRPRRPFFFLGCRYCGHPVKLSAKRFAKLFDGNRLPTCGQCRKYPVLKK